MTERPGPAGPFACPGHCCTRRYAICTVRSEARRAASSMPVDVEPPLETGAVAGQCEANDEEDRPDEKVGGFADLLADVPFGIDQRALDDTQEIEQSGDQDDRRLLDDGDRDIDDPGQGRSQ